MQLDLARECQKICQKISLDFRLKCMLPLSGESPPRRLKELKLQWLKEILFWLTSYSWRSM